MTINITRINDPEVQLFYIQYLPQYDILRDFYIGLPAEHYDYRMVDTLQRRADSPRESLAHLLEHRLIVLNGIKTRTLEFVSMDVEHYWQASKEQLLAEWERIEQELFDYVSDPTFECDAQVATPWGFVMTAVNALYLIRDHDILHVGWNLALMDHLNMDRFPALREYWG